MSDDDHNHGDGDPGKKPKLFRVQIDKQILETANASPTARELLTLAGKTPAEQYALYLKRKGGQPERLAIDQHVDLTDEGIERFVTLPLDQTEGLGSRRDFDLPSEDREWLDGLGLNYELVREGEVLRIVIHRWPVPPGYNATEVSANVRIEPGYPDSQIDMVYFYPALARSNGGTIGALAEDAFDNKTWQRWSRHRTPANPWRPGVDNLATHFGLVSEWLQRELAKG
ncbi:MAG: hypothetical protein JWP35_4508 [Caulobacter sp.]|nr:hypothetical protein [Caulobacter sp.]